MAFFPVRHIFSVFKKHGVEALLFGGQACVLYEASENSRDIDLLVNPTEENFTRILSTLEELNARHFGFLPFELATLQKGLAIHLFCPHPGIRERRLDLLAKSRKITDFCRLWERRTTFFDPIGEMNIDVISLEDLVLSKKTKRAEDWDIIRRLVEIDYEEASGTASTRQIEFWLLECRSPELLINMASRWETEAEQLSSQRPLLVNVLNTTVSGLDKQFLSEETAEREEDRHYCDDLERIKKVYRRLRDERNQKARIEGGIADFVHTPPISPSPVA